MKAKLSPWTTLAVLGMLLAPAQAFAIDRWLPAAGSISTVGMFNNTPYVVSWTGGSNCVAQSLAPANSGGLTANTTIWGSWAGDWVVVTDGFGDFCGYWLTPINTSSYTLNVKGSLAGDYLDARWTQAAVMAGDEDNDTLTTQVGGAFMYGFSGVDTIYGSTNSSVFGEGQNDKMCTQPGATSLFVDGGGGSNTFCGNVPLWGYWNAAYNCAGC